MANSVDFYLGRSANPQIFIGKHGEMFTGEMLGDLCIPHDDRRYAAETAQKLKRAQDIIRGMGKGFVVVLSPNKASIQQENLPYYCQPQTERLFVQMAQRLKAEGVAFINTEDLAAKSRSDRMPNWFGQYGQHWNSVGVFYATRAVLDELGKQMSKPLGKLEIDRLTIDNQPTGDEADTGQLSNLAFPLRPETPHATVKLVASGTKLRPLIVGTSFSGGLIGQLISSGATETITLYNYFHWIFQIQAPSSASVSVPGDAEEQYQREVNAVDSVIVEVNASAMQSTHLSRFAEATMGLAVANNP